MLMRDRFAPLIAVGLVLSATAGARTQSGPPRASVSPVVEFNGAHAGGAVRVALSVVLPDGLHANSNKPRDPSLIAMELRIAPPAGVAVEEIVWPAATDLEQEGSELPLAVFERQFAIGVSLNLDPSVAQGELAVPATLRYQACDNKQCYFPATTEAAWVLRVVPASAPLTSQNGPVFRNLRFGSGEVPGTGAPSSAADPPAPGASAPINEDMLAALGGFTIRGTTAGRLGTADFVQFIRDAEAGVTEAGWFEERGPLAILLIVLLGGLALNLTPCVLPLIPINLAIIGAGVRAGSRSRGFLLGAAYGGAMAFVYGVLGLVVILAAGTFGAINSSPWFNLGIAALFVVLALAMFDLLVIDFSRLSSRFRIRDSGRGTFVVAFTMGAVAAMLAGACVAPVVIQVVLFASSLYATGTTLALALPFFLGLGMALPWPIAGAGIAALPKPGAWMVGVKRAFGVFILGTAVYYGYLAYGLLANRWVDPVAVESSVANKVKEGWHASLVSGLEAAQREDKSVLVDLWATWCKNCLVMDSTTLADSDVTAALSDYVKIKLQAEDLSEPHVRGVMQHFGAIGLPTYVILKPRP